MIRLIVVSFLLISAANLFAQPTYDTKYKAEYVLKDIHGNEINRIKLVRNGSKFKFTIVNNRGKANESTTDMFIFKDESKVYTLITAGSVKIGNRHALDMSFVGMQTGVYILELGNDGSIFNNNSRGGSETVLGNDCVKYTIMTAPDGGSYYYMYQDNLMLKRVAATTTDGTVLEAVSYDNNTDIPESTFTLPSDVTFTDY